MDSSATSSPNSHHNPLLPEPLCYFPKPKRSFAARTAHSWERHLSYAPHTQLYGFQPCFRPRCVDPRWAAPWTGHLATQAQSWNILGGLSTHDELRDREKHVIISNVIDPQVILWLPSFKWHLTSLKRIPYISRFHPFLQLFPHFHRISPVATRSIQSPSAPWQFLQGPPLVISGSARASGKTWRSRIRRGSWAEL